MPICSCEDTINEFEMLTRDAERVQQDTLERILELNADAEYLNHFGLNGRRDVDSYKSCIPLCVHSDLEPYIQRIADGDTSPILTGKPVTSLSLRYCYCLKNALVVYNYLRSSMFNFSLSLWFQFWYNTRKA
jgi:jasmonic acid-amino synthetase